MPPVCHFLLSADGLSGSIAHYDDFNIPGWAISWTEKLLLHRRRRTPQVWAANHVSVWPWKLLLLSETARNEAHIAVTSSSSLPDDADLTAVANRAKYREKLITRPGLAAHLLCGYYCMSLEMLRELPVLSGPCIVLLLNFDPQKPIYRTALSQWRKWLCDSKNNILSKCPL